ncbi:MAG: preprotein translocase subunit SecE [Candidatus Buchananbacteria bacterium]
MSMLNKISNYLKESYQEMKKVTWPTRQQTINYSLLVIGISLGVAIFLGVIDYILIFGMEKFFIK